MTERWLPIADYEGRYEVSDQGRVRSLARFDTMGRRVGERILSAFIGSHGYAMVGLCAKGIRHGICIHRLVATAFHGIPEPGQVVCHIDGDKRNNGAGNLRWGSYSDNLHDQVRHSTHFHALKTHCPAGHLYTPDNTYTYRGRRNCRVCARARNAAYRERKGPAA